MYPTYMREELRFAPGDAGAVMSIFGLGALASLAGGFLGDRYPMRPVLFGSFAAAGLTGWLLFNAPAEFAIQASLAFAWGVAAPGAIYVNLAAYHVKAVTGELSGRASGIFVTSFYTAASVAGYTIGWLAAEFGWTIAGEVQLCGACLAGALIALALNPEAMARPRFTEGPARV
jgi:DHA1 family inner membrane transport protein